MERKQTRKNFKEILERLTGYGKWYTVERAAQQAATWQAPSHDNKLTIIIKLSFKSGSLKKDLPSCLTQNNCDSLF